MNAAVSIPDHELTAGMWALMLASAVGGAVLAWVINWLADRPIPRRPEPPPGLDMPVGQRWPAAHATVEYPSLADRLKQVLSLGGVR